MARERGPRECPVCCHHIEPSGGICENVSLSPGSLVGGGRVITSVSLGVEVSPTHLSFLHSWASLSLFTDVFDDL